MTTKNQTPRKTARQRLKEAAPLIHCITNPISINDCANALLAVGARPVMAEHPREAEEITATAAALAVNLGNITDARMESMLLSGRKARELGLPRILDAVGVSCSGLRRDYAREWIRQCAPSVIKGNQAEIKTLCGISVSSTGIDAGEADQLNPDSLSSQAAAAQRLAAETGAVILASGKTDLITDGETVFLVENGCPQMARLTGTGCMLGALAAAFLTVLPPAEAAWTAAVFFGVCGQRAQTDQGMGSFHVGLLDALDRLPEEELEAEARCSVYIPSMERRKQHL